MRNAVKNIAALQMRLAPEDCVPADQWGRFFVSRSAACAELRLSARSLLPLTLLLLAIPTNAGAGCVCRCVNGEMQAICSSTLDIEPICAPAICPITPPAIRPIDPPTVPPIGTSSCRSKQVLNPQTGRYEWQQICR